MNTAEISAQMQTIIAEDGPWTAHNIHLGDGLYTIGALAPDTFREEHVLRRMVQVVADLCDRPLDQLRVLDLACLEGLYGIEFARHGAQVVGVEARAPSLRKANFVKQVLGLDNITFCQGDVRELSPEKYGEFDVVLCLGILYHLDGAEVPDLIHRIASVCRRMTIIHTHISTAPRTAVEYQGHTYYGRSILEHLPQASAEERQRALWASLEKSYSLWLTRASLLNALHDERFTTVLDCQVPFVPTQPTDHVTLAAVKGSPQRLISAPGLEGLAEPRWPEHRPTLINPAQKWYYAFGRKYGRWIPGKQVLKRLLRVEWHRPRESRTPRR